MSEIVIEKGAAPTNLDDTTIRGTLARMDVGDSFLIDQAKANSVRNSIAINFHRHTNKYFRSTVKGQPKGKVRIWREK